MLSLRRLALLLLATATCALGGAADPVLDAVVQKHLGERHWYGVYVGGTKSGYALIECQAGKVGDKDAIIVDLKMRLKLVALGQKQDVRVFQKRTYLRTGELHEVSCRMKTDTTEAAATATIQGDKALLTMQMAGLPAPPKELPKPKESLRDWIAAERLAASDAKVGDTATFSMLEPLMLKEFQGTITLKERKEIVFNGVPTKVAVLDNRVPELGMDGDVVVDERGVVLEQNVGETFVLRLETEKQAKDVQYSADLVRVGCVKLDPPPRNVATLRTLRLQITGIQDPALLLSDGRQRWTKQADGSQVVDVAVAAVPPDKLAKLPVDKAKFADDLAATVFVQSDDPAIKAQAAQIVGTETDAYAAAKKINAWVFANVRKVGTAALSNASEVLKTREGDCTEHTVLFVALARAAGIPAREAAGVTAIERGDGLYYHAWPEVWIGDWIAMDPTLNEELADATHIKFAQGGAESIYRIMAIFGRLKAKIVDAPAK
ncbi:MAG TPA: transglutaminase-like domain-containing protein [Planctomycetota bacterium]|nr:transglutaminase-like domain-containing protein [Planctomycetota bacterium]